MLITKIHDNVYDGGQRRRNSEADIEQRVRSLWHVDAIYYMYIYSYRYHLDTSFRRAPVFFCLRFSVRMSRMRRWVVRGLSSADTKIVPNSCRRRSNALDAIEPSHVCCQTQNKERKFINTFTRGPFDKDVIVTEWYAVELVCQRWCPTSYRNFLIFIFFSMRIE